MLQRDWKVNTTGMDGKVVFRSTISKKHYRLKRSYWKLRKECSLAIETG